MNAFSSSSWPKEVITNGNAQNGHADSSSGTDGDSESDGDNEDALFGNDLFLNPTKQTQELNHQQ